MGLEKYSQEPRLLLLNLSTVVSLINYQNNSLYSWGMHAPLFYYFILQLDHIFELGFSSRIDIFF